MSERFTGFMETNHGELLLTTVGPVEVDDLLARLRERLLSLPDGMNVRLDLISWGEPE